LVGSINFENENEYAIFKFEEKFHPGSAVLKLKFTGELNNKMAGFYRSKYELNGEPKYMATTQFEATDARKAFPWYVTFFW
jgi:aminopeptidase 2